MDTHFIAPSAVSDEALVELLDIASKRLAFLNRRHPSVEIDTKVLENSNSTLRGLSREELEKLFHELKGS